MCKCLGYDMYDCINGNAFHVLPCDTASLHACCIVALSDSDLVMTCTPLDLAIPIYIHLKRGTCIPDMVCCVSPPMTLRPCVRVPVSLCPYVQPYAMIWETAFSRY